MVKLREWKEFLRVFLETLLKVQTQRACALGVSDEASCRFLGFNGTNAQGTGHIA